MSEVPDSQHLDLDRLPGVDAVDRLAVMAWEKTRIPVSRFSTFIAGYRAGHQDQASRLAQAEDLLRQMEWSAPDSLCQICWKWKQEGHSPDCALATLLEPKGGFRETYRATFPLPRPKPLDSQGENK